MSGLISFGILAGIALWGYGCHRLIEARAVGGDDVHRLRAAQRTRHTKHPASFMDLDRDESEAAPVLE